jgi:hypothetical protein
LPTAFFAAANAVFFAAQRFFKAATIAAFPAALSLRFGFAVTASDPGSDWPLDAAHRFRCASAMAFLPPSTRLDPDYRALP